MIQELLSFLRDPRGWGAVGRGTELDFNRCQKAEWDKGLLEAVRGRKLKG